MPTEEQIQTRQWAEQALRKGRAREALELYRKLLKHDKTEGRHYEAWLDGTAATYIALGRGREAGYVLLTLGRYGDAQRHFPVKERPLEWALCAARMGRRGEAARVFSEMGHPALAAIELEAAGAAAAARLEWERVLRDERLAGRPYETALAHLSLGEALVRIGDRAGGLRELGTAARLLEVVADEYETGGDTERAFDCYRVLLQLGRDMGSFETVAEGYLNMIRIMATLDQERTLQYYDDFIAYAVENKEHYAAAMAAREVAEYSLRMALVYDRHYLERAAELWVETAHANQLANGPVESGGQCVPGRDRRRHRAGRSRAGGADLRRARGAGPARCAPASLPRAGAPLRIGAAPAAPGPCVPRGAAQEGQLQGHLAGRPDRVGAGR